MVTLYMFRRSSVGDSLPNRKELDKRLCTSVVRSASDKRRWTFLVLTNCHKRLFHMKVEESTLIVLPYDCENSATASPSNFQLSHLQISCVS